MLQLLIRRGLAPLVRLIYRPEVHGAEKVPRTGPVIFASNHRAAVDTFLIPVIAPRPVSFLAKAEYFTGRGPRSRVFAAFLRALNYVPVERGNAAAGMAALEAARKVLDEGGAFGIYPEGTRSLDGKVHRGHTGVGALALATGAQVVPVALTGTEKMLPIGKKVPRLAKVCVRFGEPLEFSRYEGMENSPAIRRAITDEIMYKILELSELEYVDKYHKRPGEAA
ncbi:lysophospholipid acyltransferase family protein [Amycolatopsis alkalitolerans]|uniref:1-acyl-sn-glycerol-3-phosphate acyltransferase n=1 Tax=Amycolatopsis alkalitolerans TaxID=2547244 RepID=A0A5C4LTT6_9PSEU|nr:lysophospholipid acyltransferase family protein [Amycolatopsis alkalitolerans]TNC20806.1 1-acyl-sn-glycerol-3-phosphate acyltransferase [Amycolatopsis alkalitolerans]